MLLRWFVILLTALGSACGVAAEAPSGRPQSPVSAEESLKWFQLDEGLRIELVASEPQIVDPVTVRFDEQGRMWVVEYRDYPNGPPAGGKPLSRIKMLEDADGDGFFETAHTFADELSFCNGLQPWRGGVIATMAGRIAYLKDTDGDRKADVFETWYVGFAEENPQLRVNHPRFGLDNRVYVANGLRGGSAVDARNPQAKPVSLKGHDLKFDPRSGDYEAIAGNGQFGLTFDDYANRFICSNRNPLMHVVLEDRYLARNPNYAATAVINDVAAAGEASHVYPLVQAWTTSILHAGQYTAACGVDVYRGDALPKEYYGNGFTCEPTGSLVHREVLQPAGATFKSQSPYDKREFLASRDPWFRPVFLEGGPDGALYVCDMYRAVIEHPQFMPEELKNRPDLRYGDDRGRIYRIVPANFRRPKQTKIDSAAGLDALVALLDHPNCWWRETAQRLIYERRHPAAIRALEPLVRAAKTPQGRVHALWALKGLNGLTKETIVAALGDADARVREQAVVLSEPHLADDAALRDRIIALAADDDARLRFQAIQSLGGTKHDDRSPATIADALVRSGDDPWTHAAVALAVPNDLPRLVAAIVKRPIPTDADEFAVRRRLLRDVAAMAAPSLDGATAGEIKAAAAEAGWERSDAGRRLTLALLAGLSKRIKGGWPTYFNAPPGSPADQIAFANDMLATAKNGELEKELRLDALDVLTTLAVGEKETIAENDPTWGPVIRMVRDEPDGEIRAKALALVASRRAPEVGGVLLALLPKQAPAVRGQIFDALLSRPERVKLLLDAIEAGKLKARELDQARATRLLKSGDPAIRGRAEKLLASAMPADRTKALEDYKRALTLTADPRRGKEVFKKNCAACHKIGDVGIEVGPSIADLRTKTPEQVLTDVIQPNKAIDNNFVSYTVETDDGLQYVGIVTADTPGSVTLKLPEGKVVSILKKNIDSMQSNGVSLMPEGVERQIPHQDMADVISFVKNWRYLDGAVPAAPGAPPIGGSK